MDVKFVKPFLTALENVLVQFGLINIQIGQILKKQHLTAELEVTSIIGLTGDVKGNIAISLSEETTKKIVSLMMGGMEMLEMNSMARSAIGELANMVSGTAATILSQEGFNIEITPPSIIHGQDVFCMISSVETVMIPLYTQLGTIEMNIGIEL